MNPPVTEHSPPAGGRKKLLLIDDEEGLGLVLGKVFPRFEIRQELSGAAGLAAAYAWEPDVILLDLRLPDIRGEAIAAHIKRDRWLREIPVIFLSGILAGIEDERHPITLEGCLAFGKPFKVATMRWYLEAELERCAARKFELAQAEERLVAEGER